MNIRYLGHSCFQLIGQEGVCVLTDPYKGVGYELPATTSADIVTISHTHFDHNNLGCVKGVKAVCSEVKRYEINGVEIQGFDTFHDKNQGFLRGKNTVYKIQMDGICFCHLGDIGEDLSDSIIKRIGKCDVLLIPVGGTYTIDAKEAKKYVQAIMPKIVIPMHYLPEDGALDIADGTEFLSGFGDVEKYLDGEYVLNVEMLKSMPENAMKIVYMERVKEL